MNKTLLKSVAVLSLVATAVGTAQPVGAIVSGEFNGKIEGVKEHLEITGKKNSNYLKGEQIRKARENLAYLFDMMRYVANKEEFSEEEYKPAVKKLIETLVAYEDYLMNLESSNIDSGSSKYIFKREKLTDDRKLKKVYSQLSHLTILQYEEIRMALQTSLKEFAGDIYKIQHQHNELAPLSIYMGDFKDKNGQPIYYSLVEGDYNQFLNDYLWGNKAFLKFLDEQIDNSKLTDEYQDKISEIINLYLRIDVMAERNHEKFPEEVEMLKFGRNAIFKFNPNILVLTEDIPNLRVARDKLESLKSIIYDFYKSTKIKQGEDLEKYKPEEYSKVYDATRILSKQKDDGDSKEYQRNMRKYANGWEELRIKNLLQSNAKDPNYVIPDKEIIGDYDEDGKLIENKGDIVVETTYQAMRPMYQTQTYSYFTIDLPNTPIVFTEERVMPQVFPQKQEETIFYPVLRGTNSSNNLKSLSGESVVAGPILPEVIGGSRSASLAGQEGERSDVIETGAETPIEVISGNNGGNLAGLSGESHQVEVTYNTTSEPVSPEGVTETPEVPVVTETVPAEEVAPVEPEPVVEARDRSYHIHKAQEAIGFANEMVNSVQFYKYQADFDATTATDLEAKMTEARIALEQFLGNPADEAFTDAMVDAQVDRLEVLEANLKTLKETYAQTVNAKINDVIGQFNTAVNGTKYKLANTEYQEGVDDVFDSLYGKGKQLTVALDNLLAEGLVDLNQVHYTLLQLEDIANQVAALGN